MIGKVGFSSVTDPEFLLDANICIYVLADANGAAARAVQSNSLGSVVTSAIAYAEVMRGIPMSEAAARSRAERFFELVPPMPFDRSAALIYGELPFRRARFDRLIAAHALSLGLILVTNNEGDFADLPNLAVENWAQ